MSAATRRMFYMLLGGTRGPALPPVDPCPPYTMPAPTSADIALEEVLTLLAETAMDTNLCEELI